MKMIWSVYTGYSTTTKPKAGRAEDENRESRSTTRHKKLTGPRTVYGVHERRVHTLHDTSFTGVHMCHVPMRWSSTHAHVRCVRHLCRASHFQFHRTSLLTAHASQLSALWSAPTCTASSYTHINAQSSPCCSLLYWDWDPRVQAGPYGRGCTRAPSNLRASRPGRACARSICSAAVLCLRGACT